MERTKTMENLSNIAPNADTSAIALAFTASEETTALRSTVAWTVYIIDRVCGWNGTPTKGGRKVAIKAARKTYGFKRNADGTPVLDANGNEVKRSAIYARLSLVESLVDYLIKNQDAWVKTVHEAATDPDHSQEEKEARVTVAIEELTTQLAIDAKGETIDALKYWLDNGKAKADADPVADASAALAGGEAETDKAATNERILTEFDFDIFYNTLAANADKISVSQAQRMVALMTDIATKGAEKDEEVAKAG